MPKSSTASSFPFNSAQLVCDPAGDGGFHCEADATVQQTPDAAMEVAVDEESCLVQIYPADVVEGMMLLDSHRLTIGRDENVGLVVRDCGVSRQHAEIVRDGVGYRIRDLGSTNGTLVNEACVDEQHLVSGDTIQIGSYLFKYLSAGSVESQYHETVYSALTRDALTGTFNKRYLLESLQREVARAVRQGNVLSVVMCDIDFFKGVNDTHGHLVGDEVLREFGHRIGAICREDDLLARFGGEEFCLLMSGSESDEVSQAAERCRRAIADTPFQTAAGGLVITASFGYACLDADSVLNPTQLLENADRRLYEAKDSGRNRVCGA